MATIGGECQVSYVCHSLHVKPQALSFKDVRCEWALMTTSEILVNITYSNK